MAKSTGRPRLHRLTQPATYLVKHLQGLIAHHRHIADQLQGTLDILLADASPLPEAAGNGNGAGDPVVAAALALDSQRRAKAASPSKAPQAAQAEAPQAAAGRRRDPHYNARAVEGARRRETAAFLATFDRKVPKAVTLGAGRFSLLRMGYLAKKGAGYIRTAKPFEVDPAKVASARYQAARDAGRAKKKPVYGPKKTAERKETAALLAAYSPTIPKPLGRKVQIMVHHGYLAKAADGSGYVRTAKEFIP